MLFFYSRNEIQFEFRVFAMPGKFEKINKQPGMRMKYLRKCTNGFAITRKCDTLTGAACC